IKKYEEIPEAKEFAQLIFNLQTKVISSSALIQSLNDLQNWQTTINVKNPACSKEVLQLYDKSANGKDASTIKESRQLYNTLLMISDEVSGYVLLMLTLLDFFSSDLKEEDIISAEQNGDFHKLALAKQAMTTTPFITKSIIRDFRALHKMASLN